MDNIVTRQLDDEYELAQLNPVYSQTADGQAEAQEFRLDEKTKHCGEPLKNLKLKKNILIVCIRHEKELCIPDGESTYDIGDTVIIVTGHKQIVNIVIVDCIIQIGQAGTQ